MSDFLVHKKSELKVALVHDWLVSQRGGENVLLELASMFPNAPIYTLVYNADTADTFFKNRSIITSFIQKLPGAPHRFRQYLPLFPQALAGWNLADYDVVISSSHCVVKAVKTHARQVHISYIHTPMRYLWDQMHHYLPKGLLSRYLHPFAKVGSWPLRKWDRHTGQRPQLLLANSQYVSQRIQRVWQRPAQVLYPPVDVDFYKQDQSSKKRHGFLVVSALVPYKRVDLAVQAACQAKLPLTVIGQGPEKKRLQRLAGSQVRFIEQLSRDALRQAYSQAQALLFCGVEDFGIVPIEAMAAGCPVIALAAGGALESVCEKEGSFTGVFFQQATVQGLLQGIKKWQKLNEQGAFSALCMQKEMDRFRPAYFREGFQAVLEKALAPSSLAQSAGLR